MAGFVQVRQGSAPIDLFYSVQMKMIPVGSTVIESIGYDEAGSTLVVVLRDGHVYEFHLVPKHVCEEFLGAPSKGSFFNEVLKGGPYGQRSTRRI